MYFGKFPIVQYPLKHENKLQYVLARNLLRRIALSSDLTGVNSAFIEYSVKDGEKPEHIASKLYGDPELYWLVLLTNTVMNPYSDWYKSDSVMQEYLQTKYTTNCLYFTDVSDGFTFSPYITDGATLTQGNKSATIVNYHPTFCKLDVQGFDFNTGNATVIGTNGIRINVKIHRVENSSLSVHHFQVSKVVNGQEIFVSVDPLSQQTGSYSYAGGVIGGTTDVYPPVSHTVPYTPTGTVDFNETYIGKYMGVGVNQVNTYAVSNRSHEMTVNDSKRNIRLLHPRYKASAVRELDALLRV